MKFVWDMQGHGHIPITFSKFSKLTLTITMHLNSKAIRKEKVALKLVGFLNVKELKNKHYMNFFSFLTFSLENEEVELVKRKNFLPI